MSTWRVPGLALAIVQNGRVVLARGFGQRAVGQAAAVTPDTVFAIGSISKSFTSLAFAILADEGKVSWDTPVRRYLPSFRLSDPVATDEATARDLFSHRTGLPAHDLVWYSSNFDREDLVRRLQYLPFSRPFRSTFQYSNLLVAALGYLEGRVSGSTWENLVRSRILIPLDMQRSDFSVTDSERLADVAQPYELRKDVVVRVPFKNVDAIGPAGSINSSVNDLSRFLILQLGDGTHRGRRLVSQANLQLTHTGQTAIVPLPEVFKLPELGPMSYGMGWVQTTYRGHAMVWNNGSIDGFHSLITLLPADHIGVVLLSNLGESLALEPIAYSVYDRLLGLPAVRWVDRYRELQEHFDKQTTARNGRRDSLEHAVPRGRPLSDLVGRYANPGYGTVAVTERNATLQIALNQLPAQPLIRREGDVFEVHAGEPGPLEGARAAFEIYRDGRGRLALPLEPSLQKDIVFIRARPDGASVGAVSTLP